MSESTVNPYELMQRNWIAAERFRIQAAMLKCLHSFIETNEQKIAAFRVFCEVHPEFGMTVMEMINQVLASAGLDTFDPVDLHHPESGDTYIVWFSPQIREFMSDGNQPPLDDAAAMMTMANTSDSKAPVQLTVEEKKAAVTAMCSSGDNEGS